METGMTRTEKLLAMLATENVPEQLDGIEAGVFLRFGRKLEARAARRSLAMACFIAAFIGGGSAVFPRSSAEAELPPLGVPAEAPSNLLMHG